MAVLSNRDIAESSPDELLINPFFWFKKQRGFLGVLFMGIFIAVFVFYKYTYSAFDSLLSNISNIFNLCIHSVGIWGIFITAKAIARVEVERAIANEIIKKGKRELDKVVQPELSELEEILPSNTSTPSLAMLRLFRHICEEAKNLRFESSIDVVEPYRDESLESLFTITNIQKIALRAGILGTFIGLIEAIMQLSSLNDNQSSIDTIVTLSKALFISFSTSVAGLEVTIILGFLIMILRKHQENYFSDMESSVIVILRLARKANNDDKSILGDLAQLDSTIANLGSKLSVNTSAIQYSIDTVLKGIKAQTTEIDAGIQQIKQTKVEFDKFISEIGRVQYKFIGEVKEIYDDLSLKTFKDDIKNGILFAGQTVANRIGETEASIQRQTEQINQGINTLLETRVKFTTFLQQIDSSQVKFIENVRESQDIVAMVKSSTELQSTIDELQYTINEAVQKIDVTVLSMSKITNEITDGMELINESLNVPLIERLKRNFFK